MEIFEYKTIDSFSTGEYKEKGSKFIALANPVKSENEIKEYLDIVKKEHHGARHFCYAWRIGVEHCHSRANDDGEPAGTAGKPILAQLEKFDLTNILIIVVRYFGGKLLGTSGLVNAYRSAAAIAIANSSIVDKTVQQKLEILFPYESINEIMTLIKEADAEKVSQNIDMNCKLIINISKEKSKNLISRLETIENVIYKSY